MKRSAKRNIGQWPNMQEATLKAVAEELVRARKSYPRTGEHVVLLKSYVEELEFSLVLHDNDKQSPAQIYACAVAVAAMAIRLIEEGDSFHKYDGINRV